MLSEGETLKSVLAGRREAIEAAHRNGAGGFETCASLTGMMDEALGTAFRSLPREAQDRIAVIALGGYGRGELFPHSDLDVMLICPSGDLRESASRDARSFLHRIWDAGFNVGHSVRTIDEVLALHGTVLDAWTSVLESRFLVGSRELWETLRARMIGVIGGRRDQWLLEGVFGNARSRHERYGNSVKLLEPNIKKSAGGLRDMHNILWLHRGTNPRYFEDSLPAHSSTETFLDHLARDGGITGEEHARAMDALGFLFRLRHEMHFRQNSLNDTLEYTLQLNVAEGLGYLSAPDDEIQGRRGVERFMRDYYLHARTVHLLHQRLSHEFREALEAGRHEATAGKALGDHFLLSDGALSVEQSVRQFTEPRILFEAFALAAEHNVGPDFRLRAAIERSAGIIGEPERSSATLSELFQRVLSSSRSSATLHDMNDLGILGRFIPEFGDLIAFFQHNVYHYYTADEHTLIAIARAEALGTGKGILSDVFRSLPRRDILYLALLLHDIGKPHGVADHEITGIEIARTVLHRLGLQSMFPEVSFLVQHHLLMEQIAFRRNIHDADTIREFAAKFERPDQLDYLYVLTYADLAAVNTTVWTAWKAAMLQELYQRGAEAVRSRVSGEQIDDLHKARREAAAGRVVEALSSAMPRELVERHLRGMNSEAYVSLFSEAEIGRHIEAGDLRESVTAHFSDAEGYTDVTIIARDAPYALSKFCAVLSANDADIFDANVFTRDDGIIIDRFRVTGRVSRHRLEGDACAKISEDLRKVVEGTLDIHKLFAAHHRRWKRRPKVPVHAGTKMDVVFEDNPRFTIIDVYAPDTVGFLYRTTETMSRLGLDIYFAKIATRADGIVDAFYVLDRDGKQLKGRARRAAIKEEILATIRKTAEEELA